MGAACAHTSSILAGRASACCLGCVHELLGLLSRPMEDSDAEAPPTKAASGRQMAAMGRSVVIDAWPVTLVQLLRQRRQDGIEVG